ncbi:methyltransferase family protein [Capnocytophaga canimorsus]|uniref:methyltransferase family protein n=1 Tax=Capnocytophaga canimorsus TaxID=28188 RepID=UPI00385FE47E
MLDLKVPPVIVLAIFAGIIVGIPYIFPFYRGKSFGLCVLFVVLGVVIALSGVWEFRKFKTTVNPITPENSSRIVDTGIYRFSRNPMYLGMTFVLMGLVFLWGNYLSWLGVVGFVIYIIRFQIIPEEKILNEIFGEDYREYFRKTPRWL